MSFHHDSKERDSHHPEGKHTVRHDRIKHRFLPREQILPHHLLPIIPQPHHFIFKKVHKGLLIPAQTTVSSGAQPDPGDQPPPFRMKTYSLRPRNSLQSSSVTSAGESSHSSSSFDSDSYSRAKSSASAPCRYAALRSYTTSPKRKKPPPRS